MKSAIQDLYIRQKYIYKNSSKINLIQLCFVRIITLDLFGKTSIEWSYLNLELLGNLIIIQIHITLIYKL